MACIRRNEHETKVNFCLTKHVRLKEFSHAQTFDRGGMHWSTVTARLHLALKTAVILTKISFFLCLLPNLCL